MDYQKKKLLTQSVSYLQANLMVTPDLLKGLQSREVLTGEEVHTIQKDEIMTGKVLELVCLLKRKDNRTYNRFVTGMDELNFPIIAKLLKSKGDSLSSEPDPRTIHYIEVQLGKNVSVDQRHVKDMAGGLVLKEIHKDEVRALQDKVHQLQRQLKAKMSQSSPDGSRMTTPQPAGGGGDLTRPKTPSVSGSTGDPTSPKWDVPTQMEEMTSILKQKDDIMKKKDEEYGKLRTILGDTQNDLQSVLDLNSQYLTIIGQLNQMQIAANASPRMSDKTDEDLTYEQKLEAKDNDIKRLRGELDGIQGELTDKEKDLNKVSLRDKKYKSMLGLLPDATDDEVERRIQEILMDGSLRKQEVDKIKKELQKIATTKVILEEKVGTIQREKEKVEFQIRQQDLAMKKMGRMRTSSNVLQSAQKMLAANVGEGGMNYVRLPSMDHPSVQFRIQSARALKAAGGFQYCMFCRQEFQQSKSRGCRTHFRPIRNGKWLCCKDDCHRGAGCLQVPHFYIEISADKKVLLTDGAKYMDIS